MEIKNFEKRHIDNNHYFVTEKEAKALCLEVHRDNLPVWGWETRVRVNGSLWWLSRTQYKCKTIWCLHGERKERNGAY